MKIVPQKHDAKVDSSSYMFYINTSFDGIYL